MTDANTAQIRAFLSGLQTLAAFVDSDGAIADHNEPYAEFFGLSDGSGGVERTEADWLDGATEDGSLESAWRGETVRFEREMTGAHGAARFNVSLIPFMPSSGEVAGIILSASRVSPAMEGAGLHSFVAALDAVADGIVVFDADDRLVYGNSRMREARKDIAQVFLPGTSFEEFVCAFARSNDTLTGDLDLGAWYERRLARYRDPGEPFEFRLGDKWFLCREHRAADGGTLCIYTDITETKRAEHEARRQALIWMQVSEAVVVLDADGTILDLNPGAERMFGYSKTELLGRYSSVLHVEERSGALRQSIGEEMARDGHWTGEVLVRRKDGSTLICESDVIQIKDEFGNAIGRIAVCRDITERATSEQELRRSEERFRGLAEASFDAIIVAEGVRIIDVNDKAVALFGYQRDDDQPPLCGPV